MFSRFWNWLKSWRNRPSLETYLEIYTPEERKIFRYHNGSRWIEADPAPLWERLMDKSAELGANFKAAAVPSKWQQEANRNVIKYLREVFEIAPLEDGWKMPTEGSLTGEQVVELFNVFMTFCGCVKKNSSPGPTLPETTLDTCEPTLDGPPPTLSFSGCGSTAAANSTAESGSTNSVLKSLLETSVPPETTGSTSPTDPKKPLP